MQFLKKRVFMFLAGAAVISGIAANFIYDSPNSLETWIYSGIAILAVAILLSYGTTGVEKQAKELAKELLLERSREEASKLTKDFLATLYNAQQNRDPVPRKECRQWELGIGIPYKIGLRSPENTDGPTLGFGQNVDTLCQRIREQAWLPVRLGHTAFEQQDLPSLEEVDDAFK